MNNCFTFVKYTKAWVAKAPPRLCPVIVIVADECKAFIALTLFKSYFSIDWNEW